MPSEFHRSLSPPCPTCSGGLFELRVLKDEGLAAAQCLACERNYLLLDSEDYWFDVIQQGYPRLIRCSCKSASFRLRLDYTLREDGDVEYIELWSTCSVCGKSKRQTSLDIDYGDTGELVTTPLRYCKEPKLLYDLKDLSLYATREDIARVIDYLHTELRCSFIGWLRESDNWVMRTLAASEARNAIVTDGGPGRIDRYLRIYASLHPLEIRESEVDRLKDEASFWKRHEIVRLSSPTHMGIGEAKALLFYIQFANEHVVDGTRVQKSAEFREATASLVQWLTVTFVSWRGPRSFDNPAENLRVFGERFAKGRRM